MNRADIEGLTALAACCDEQAAAVWGTGAAPPVGGTFQATSVAVSGVHADVDLAAAQLMARLQSTAAAVTTAATGFGDTEADNAEAVSSVSDGIVEV